MRRAVLATLAAIFLTVLAAPVGQAEPKPPPPKCNIAQITPELHMKVCVAFVPYSDGTRLYEGFATVTNTSGAAFTTSLRVDLFYQSTVKYGDAQSKYLVPGDWLHAGVSAKLPASAGLGSVARARIEKPGYLEYIYSPTM